jgi:hypothetical protein
MRANMSSAAQLDHGEKPLNIHFLPINDANPTGSRPFVRAYLSCDNCRKRKSRCDQPESASGRCSRCIREGKVCNFTQRRPRRKRDRDGCQSLAPLDQDQSNTAVWDGMAPANLDSNPHGASDGDNPDADASHTTVTNRLISTQLSSAYDALGVLAFTATQSHADAATPGDHLPQGSRNAGRQHLSQELPGDFLLVRKGILTREEMVEYLEFYFRTLWPLRPVVHAHYSRRENFSDLINEEPMLAVTLTLLASRHHILSGARGEARSERIHWRVWPWLKSYLQSALWGSKSTRTCGAVASMLLLMEWHFKAINFKADLADQLDSPSWEHRRSRDHGDSNGCNNPSEHSSRFAVFEEPKLTISAYQGNRMSWFVHPSPFDITA